MAVTQCQLTWALLATIGCSAVRSDDDGDYDCGCGDDDGDYDGGDDYDCDQAEILLSGVARSLLSWHRRIPREITCQIYMSSLHNYIVSSTRSSYTDLIRILYWSSMNQRDFSVGFA